MKSKREELRKQRQRKQNITRMLWIAAAVIAVAVIGYAVWPEERPPDEETIPIMADVTHVDEGTDPGPFNSDPPSSGQHYPSELDAGFYDTNEYDYPAGYLVHNLEHGYIIFWYDCDEVEEGQCEPLKADIRAVLEAENYNKVIAYPWDLQGETVVLTSWGKRLGMETFDPEGARSFASRNRNKSPEPNAP